MYYIFYDLKLLYKTYATRGPTAASAKITPNIFITNLITIINKLYRFIINIH